MAVLTRPEEAPPRPVPLDDVSTAPMPKMATRLANALVTMAPMSKVELHAVRLHFLTLTSLLDVSGPSFSAMRRQAVDMHNRAVRRLNDVADWERRQAAEVDEGKLLEIER